MPEQSSLMRCDSIQIDQTYFTPEGYLIDHPIVTSTGIFEYHNPDGSVRRELRLPEEVFAPDSLASYEGKPVIVTHEAGLVTKDNVNQEHIGTILSPGYREGEKVRAKIIIHETDALQYGLRELSLGYNLELDEAPGEWEGQPYDAIQRNIRVNHLALMANARAGDDARLNIDGESPAEGGTHMAEEITTKTDSLLPEEVQAAIEAFKQRQAARSAPPSGASPVGDSEGTPPVTTPKSDAEETVQMVKDRRDRRDAEEAPDTPEKAIGVIAQQDEDIESLLQLIAQLMAKQDFDSAGSCNPQGDSEGEPPSGPPKADSSDDKSGSLNMDSTDELIRERLEIARLGDRLNLSGLESLPVMKARQAIIKAVRPDFRCDGKDPAYLKAAYDLARDEIMKRKDTNAQRRQMFNPDPNRMRMDSTGVISEADKARQKMIERQMKGAN